jgi:hypothetical protein
MEPDKNCKGCAEKDRCQSIYEAMGKFKGESVLVKVVLVFLLPILIFIASLIIYEGYLQKLTDNKNLIIACSAVLSAATALVYILITSAVYKRRYKDRN